MIRMGRYDLNPRNGQISIHEREEKSAEEIFREVKRVRHDLIRAHSITDEELKKLIAKIKSGTRNLMYLGEGRRFRDIAAYIVREYT